ncbi:MAG: hypothetical protein V7K48_22805 [Nostoc sp.]|uniref:hypothetical protein n=1 Tax=Nostoc sp. TaxID=1180 RepID=UPI002FF4EF1A
MIRRIFIAFLAFCLAILSAEASDLLIKQKPVIAQSPTSKNLIVGMTTSIQDSGLLDDLVPAIEKKTGYKLIGKTTPKNTLLF